MSSSGSSVKKPASDLTGVCPNSSHVAPVGGRRGSLSVLRRTPRKVGSTPNAGIAPLVDPEAID